MDVAAVQGLLVRSALLAGIAEKSPRSIQERVFAPGFAENRYAGGSQNTVQLPGRCLQVEVVQHRVAPNTIKASLGEGQALAVHLYKINGDAIGVGSGLGLGEIAGRQVEGSHASAAAGQDNGGHAVPAPEIEDAQAANIAQLGHRRANPGFMIQVGVVVENQLVRPARKMRRPLPGLPVVKGAFAGEAVRRGGHELTPAASLSFSRR